MTGTPPAAGAPKPAVARVYGVDHSPWVQAVLLGLHERGVDHTLVSAPPLSVFLRSGVLMPAASLDGGPWTLDSERILVALGFPEVAPESRRALQTLFRGTAMHRCDRPFEFWRRFSRVRERHPSPARRHGTAFFRAFPVFYFFSVITLGRRTLRAGPEQVVRDLCALQQQLGPDAPFFGGERPDTVDLQLFGIVQMLASIPGPPLETLREAPELARLREWVAQMQRRFAEHPGLYSADGFDPRLPPPAPAPASERAAFWCGAALVWLAFPISLAVTLFYLRRVRTLGLQRP